MSQEQKDRVAEDAGKLSQTPAPEATPSPEAEVEAVKEPEEGLQADVQVDGQAEEPTEQTAQPRTRKRAKRKTKLVNVEEIMPRPSLWPLGLAVSVAITLFGIIAGPIVCAIGVVLVIVSIVGWSLERR